MSENGTEHMEDRPPQQETSSYPENPSLPIDVKVCGIFTYGDQPHKDEFEKDCQQLQEALAFDGAYESHSSSRITVVESKLLQGEFFKHMMQWEREIVNAAKTVLMEKLLRLSEAEVCHDIRLIYAHMKSCNAFSIIDSQIARMTSLTIQSENRKKQQENITRILDVVKERWIILERLHGNDDECALFLSTAMTLCTVPLSTMEKQFVHDDDKVLQLIRYLSKCEAQHLQESDKQFADNYFKEWVYARGIPIAGDGELTHIIDQLKCKLSTYSKALTEEFIRVTIKCLRRLEDRTFWFHYSGHHRSDGVQVSTDRIPLLHHTLQAAGSLVSNLVVTIDCCFADAYVETYRFTVDAQAKNSGFTVISSCCSDSEAPVHSIFTPLLIQALRRPVNCAFVKDLRPGGIKLPARECQHCMRFAQKCKASETISIARIFSYITCHLGSGPQIPTIRRHYSNEQLPVSRFVDTNGSFNCT